MGAKCSSSHLSEGKYGYDFVVAMTQESINGMMLQFLDSGDGEEVEVCYTMSDDHQYVSTTLEDLKKSTDGVDPFTIPDQTDPQDPRVQALKKVRFIAGFRAKIGIPYTEQPDLLPDVITLNQDASQVVFRAMCSEFQVVALQANVYDPPLSWVSKSQPPEDPWIFTVDVNLQTSVIDDQDIRALPDEVQVRISVLRKMGHKTSTQFDIKHLLLDLASAPRRSEPFITGLDKNSPIRAFLEDAFQETYIKVLTKPGNPLLGCIAVARNPPPTPSQPMLTDFHLMVNPYVGEDGLPVAEPPEQAVKCTTLNYLCSWDGHRLPPAHKFSWNWVNMLELGDHDGVVAINRTWLANHLAKSVENFVASRCRLMDVQCDTTSGGSVHYNCEFPSYTAVVPTVSSAPDAKVLSFRYKSKDQDQCGAGGCLGQLEVRYEYGMDVSFAGHTITVEQTQLLHVFLQRLRTKKSGDYIKRSWTDTFSIGVDGYGGLVVKPDIKGKEVNHSDGIPDDSSIASSAEIRSIVGKLNTAAPLASPDIDKLALGPVHDFVFPAGNTFYYKKAEFSDFQDLLCQITYRVQGRKVVRIPRRQPQAQRNDNATSD